MSVIQPAPEALSPSIQPFVLDRQAPLAKLWDQPLSKLVELEPYVAVEGENERHTIYSLALMKLVKEYWNGNRKGVAGEYPQRKNQLWQEVSGNGNFIYRANKTDDPRAPEMRVRDYLGHNIAAIAVDGDGNIIDFEFNHNEIFCSSVEHAESRLIRRIFSLALLDEGWNLSKFRSSSRPATNLGSVTVYTSLEPCAQCVGIMMLAGVKQVVYLHRDFGTSSIGNIIYNLTRSTPIPSPRPIPASDFKLEHFNSLTEGFRRFSKTVGQEAFWKHPTDAKRNDTSASVVSFLCTDEAYEIYATAAEEFDAYQLKVPDHPPDQDPPQSDSAATFAGSVPTFKVKRNQEVLASAQRFVKEAVRIGRRGTPHQL